MKFKHALLILPIALSACAEQEPRTPAQQAAWKAEYFNFINRQCASNLGGSGVADLARESAAARKEAVQLGATSADFNAANTTISTGWAFSTGMMGRLDTCNSWITSAYNSIAASN